MYKPNTNRVRGGRFDYPASSVMIELLVINHNVTWAGWYSERNLRRAWDEVNADFFMNRDSKRFKRQWEIDGRDLRR